MMDFPNSPSVGQTYNSGSGAIYVWDGVAWSIATSQTATALSRNLIVNPCGRISQENAQTAGTVDSYYIADQWLVRLNASGAAISAKSDTAVVNSSGSIMRLLYKTTTIKASLAAGEYAAIMTRLEGVRIEALGYMGNTPLQSVLRFGFNGPAGTYSVSIRNTGALTLSWIGQFTITAGQANVDTTQVLVIPPPPSGYVWAGSSNGTIDLYISLATSATLTAPANGWQAGNFLAGPGQFNLLGTVNNQAQIWDVGLYADPNRTGLPPAFQVPDYALDLFECLRYWEKRVILFTNAKSGSAAVFLDTPYAVLKRATPSIATSGLIDNDGTGVTSVSFSNVDTSKFGTPTLVGGTFPAASRYGITATANARM